MWKDTRKKRNKKQKIFTDFFHLYYFEKYLVKKKKRDYVKSQEEN